MNALFTRIAGEISRYAGRPFTFIAAIVIIVGWAASGPLFGFSDTWQLVVNTGTTIITFLMVFLIQNTQNRDSAALQAKLDELLRAVSNARESKFIGVEHLTDEEIEKLRRELEEAVQSGDPKEASHALSKAQSKVTRARRSRPSTPRRKTASKQRKNR
jgi:low affinity Fe/Cu permease